MSALSYHGRNPHPSELVALSDAQAKPEWLARFKTRDMGAPLVFEDDNLKVIHTWGITDLATAGAFLRKWVDAGQEEIPGTFFCGSRDMCWHVSWYLEVLEGRIEDDVPTKYYPHYYLRSRYGIQLYALMW